MKESTERKHLALQQARAIVKWKKEWKLDKRCVLTPDKITKLETGTKRGLPQALACEYSGIKHITFQKWKSHYHDNFDSPYRVVIEPYLTAKFDYIFAKLDTLKAAGEDPKYWKAALVELERFCPDHFAKPELIMQQPDNVPKLSVYIGNVENLNFAEILAEGTDKSVIDADVLEPKSLNP